MPQQNSNLRCLNFPIHTLSLPQQGPAQGLKMTTLTVLCGNEPFGSRPEPGTYLIAPILQLPPGEVPEGPAGAHLQSIG